MAVYGSCYSFLLELRQTILKFFSHIILFFQFSHRVKIKNFCLLVEMLIKINESLFIQFNLSVNKTNEIQFMMFCVIYYSLEFMKLKT